MFPLGERQYVGISQQCCRQIPAQRLGLALLVNATSSIVTHYFNTDKTPTCGQRSPNSPVRGSETDWQGNVHAIGSELWRSAGHVFQMKQPEIGDPGEGIADGRH